MILASLVTGQNVLGHLTYIVDYTVTDYGEECLSGQATLDSTKPCHA